jgi:hypothetical protein
MSVRQVCASSDNTFFFSSSSSSFEFELIEIEKYCLAEAFNLVALVHEDFILFSVLRQVSIAIKVLRLLSNSCLRDLLCEALSLKGAGRLCGVGASGWM